MQHTLAKQAVLQTSCRLSEQIFVLQVRPGITGVQHHLVVSSVWTPTCPIPLLMTRTPLAFVAGQHDIVYVFVVFPSTSRTLLSRAVPFHSDSSKPRYMKTTD